MQAVRKLLRVVFEHTLDLRCDRLCRIHGNTISGMDTCTLDMLHDTRDQDIVAITYGINLDFLTHQIFINQNRMLLLMAIDNLHKLNDILIRDCNLHPLSA